METKPATDRRARDLAATRASLLDAARLAFTRHGYEAAGVREIADMAGADKALITRYFGSKEGLFVEAVPATFDATHLTEGDRAGFGERAVRGLLANRQQDLFHPTTAMLRSVSDPGAAEHLRAGVEQRMVAPIATWLGGEDAVLRATALVAHLAGLDLMINVLPLGPFKTCDADTLVALLAPLLQAVVDGKMDKESAS
jgi:AcrR family transcriptional regulator